MPRSKKKVSGNSDSAPGRRSEEDPFETDFSSPGSYLPSVRGNHNKNGQRKRGWRDIEAISERARLKKMLVDIWHEDVELDDDIFGECDHLSGYYADCDEDEEIEVDDDLVVDDEDFEEKEE
jgi:hypothetical protein